MKLTFTAKPLKRGQIHNIGGIKYEVLDVVPLIGYPRKRWRVELRRVKP